MKETNMPVFDERERANTKAALLNETLQFEDREPLVVRYILETDSTDNVEGLGEPPYLVCSDGINRRWVLSYPQAYSLLTDGSYEARFHEDGEEKSYYVSLKPKRL